MNIKLICSFGSCLSANIAYQVKNIIPYWYRVSSVQHNRIDQFNQIYIKKIYPELTLKDIDLKLDHKYHYVNTIDNQIRGVGLGRSLPKTDDKIPLNDIIHCIESGKIDIFIFDNFAELLFKIYKHNTLGTPMFINEGYLVEKTKLFEFINNFISIEDFKGSYENTISFITQKNPNCKIVLIPFPIINKGNPTLLERSKRQFEVMYELSKKYNNVYISDEVSIDEIDLSKSDDPYHFTDACYLKYAKNLIKTIL